MSYRETVTEGRMTAYLYEENDVWTAADQAGWVGKTYSSRAEALNAVRIANGLKES